MQSHKLEHKSPKLKRGFSKAQPVSKANDEDRQLLAWESGS